jgi:hypothetical protein
MVWLVVIVAALAYWWELHSAARYWRMESALRRLGASEERGVLDMALTMHSVHRPYLAPEPPGSLEREAWTLLEKARAAVRVA